MCLFWCRCEWIKCTKFQVISHYWGLWLGSFRSELRIQCVGSLLNAFIWYTLPQIVTFNATSHVSGRFSSVVWTVLTWNVIAAPAAMSTLNRISHLYYASRFSCMFVLSVFVSECDVFCSLVLVILLPRFSQWCNINQHMFDRNFLPEVPLPLTMLRGCFVYQHKCGY